MSTYAAHFTPDLFFVTWGTVDHEPVLVTSVAVHLLRAVLNQVKQGQPFRTLGYSFLPDHLHLLIKPEVGGALDPIISQVRRQFGQEYAQLMGVPGPLVLWQASYQLDKVRDVEDFAARLDYVHYNAVLHKLVQKPEEWPHSSYRAWCDRGLYPSGWGWTEPERVQGKRWG